MRRSSSRWQREELRRLLQDFLKLINNHDDGYVCLWGETIDREEQRQ